MSLRDWDTINVLGERSFQGIFEAGLIRDTSVNFHGTLKTILNTFEIRQSLFNRTHIIEGQFDRPFFLPLLHFPALPC